MSFLDPICVCNISFCPLETLQKQCIMQNNSMRILSMVFKFLMKWMQADVLIRTMSECYFCPHCAVSVDGNAGGGRNLTRQVVILWNCGWYFSFIKSPAFFTYSWPRCWCSLKNIPLYITIRYKLWKIVSQAGKILKQNRLKDVVI